MLATLLILFIACGALSLSMKRHFKQIFPTVIYSNKKSMALRSIGCFLLAIGLFKTIQEGGFGIGVTNFFGIFSVTVILLALIKPYLSNYIGKRKSNTIFD